MGNALLEIAKAIISLKEAVLQLQGGFSWVDCIYKILLPVGVIAGIYSLLMEIRDRKKVLMEAQHQKERENIQKKLNFFFGPLKELGTESKLLYDHFALKEKTEAKDNKEKNFRTLRHLSQGKDFNAQDRVILEQIIEITNKQRKLIEKEGQLIENSQLSLLLGKLGSHVRLLSLASDHKLDGMDVVLEDIVFPKELDGAIESEIRRLQDQHKKYDPLYKKSDPATLTKDQKKTIKHYDKDPLSYFRATASINMNDMYELFLPEVSYGGLILDAGCGVGRDTRSFIKSGYRVVSIDASAEMARLCNRYPFAYCLHKSFADIDYFEEFDGVWASASLIHLNEQDFKEALFKLSNALKPGGILFFSLKKDTRDTRKTTKLKTYFYSEDFVKACLGNGEYQLGFNQIKTTYTKSRKKDDATNWVSYFCKKTNS